MKQIIGLSGKAGSGKDFVAKQILRGHDYLQVGFSWALKYQAMQTFEHTYDEVFVVKPEHVRRDLISLGMLYRNSDPLYWVKQTMRMLEVLHREAGVEKFVITDVRFENEAEAIRNAGGKLVRLLHGDRHYPLRDTEWESHESETGLDQWSDWDLELVNNRGTSAADITALLRNAGVLPKIYSGKLGAIRELPGQLALFDAVGAH